MKNPLANIATSAWFTRALGWLAAAKYWLAVVVLVGVLSFLKGCDTGKKLEAANNIKAEREARHTSDLSAGEAAGERGTDRAVIGEAQAQRDRAIEEAPDDTARPSAKSNALNCQRLRERLTPAQLRDRADYQKYCEGE